MGADPAEEHFSLGSLRKLEGEAVVHGHGTFPAIDSPDEFFDPQGRVPGIIEKKRKFCIEGVPDVGRQGAVILPEAFAEFITCYFFSHSNPSAAVWKVGDVSPFAISPSTSFSAACHSFVQYHPWVGSISFLGFKAM